MNYKLYMIAIVLLGTSFKILSALEIFTKRSTKGVSLPAWIICLFVNLNWLLYGIYIDDNIIIASNILDVVAIAFVLVGLIKYRNN